jgi:hypothetical protein
LIVASTKCASIGVNSFADATHASRSAEVERNQSNHVAHFARFRASSQMVSLSRLTSNLAPGTLTFQLTISGFESSRPSQPVRRLEISTSVMPVMPASGRPLRIGGRSPDSEFGHFRTKTADSLQRILEIFPFSGDRGRRPGSIYTAWPRRQTLYDNTAGLTRAVYWIIRPVVRTRQTTRRSTQY